MLKNYIYIYIYHIILYTHTYVYVCMLRNFDQMWVYSHRSFFAKNPPKVRDHSESLINRMKSYSRSKSTF